MAAVQKKIPLLRKQPPMRRVIRALIPCMAGSVYFFGWRCLALVVVSCLCAFLAEWSFCRRRHEPVSEAVFVTGILYALVMPPTVPWHVLIVGIVFAMVFVKEAFGGFGRNVFNPAVSGRCFVYVCFPVAMTGTWAPVATGVWGALARWTTAMPDAITSATPMGLLKAGAYAGEGPPVLWERLFLGTIAGTLGVTSVLLILMGGVYLFATKAANRTLILTVVAVYAGLNQVLHMLGVPPVPDGLTAVLGGGFLFGAFFMVTDPVSAAKTPRGRVYYAALIAICTVIIRNFSIFNGGLMFSIMIGNMFAPIIDHAVKGRNVAA